MSTVNFGYNRPVPYIPRIESSFLAVKQIFPNHYKDFSRHYALVSLAQNLSLF